MTAANRGKHAEEKVRAYLKRVDAAVTNFDWERVLDAHAAGGRFQSRTGDFSWWATNMHGVIEVKEVAHICRLSYKNFSLEEVGKLRKRELAGGVIMILVCHTVPTVHWRRPLFDGFKARDEATPSGSWDLSEYPTFTSVEAALAGTDLAF